MPIKREPEHPVALKDVITQGELLGFSALTGIEQAEDVQDGEHERDHGELDPDDLVVRRAPARPVRSNAQRQ